MYGGGHTADTPPYPYDPEKAKALLAEAGYADELQLVPDVSTILPDETTYLARRIVEQYAKVGIVTEIREFT